MQFRWTLTNLNRSQGLGFLMYVSLSHSQSALGLMLGLICWYYTADHTHATAFLVDQSMCWQLDHQSSSRIVCLHACVFSHYSPNDWRAALCFCFLRFHTVIDKRLLTKLVITSTGTLGSLITTLVALGTEADHGKGSVGNLTTFQHEN